MTQPKVVRVGGFLVTRPLPHLLGRIVHIGAGGQVNDTEVWLSRQ